MAPYLASNPLLYIVVFELSPAVSILVRLNPVPPRMCLKVGRPALIYNFIHKYLWQKIKRLTRF